MAAERTDRVCSWDLVHRIFSTIKLVTLILNSDACRKNFLIRSTQYESECVNFYVQTLLLALTVIAWILGCIRVSVYHWSASEKFFCPNFEENSLSLMENRLGWWNFSLKHKLPAQIQFSNRSRESLGGEVQNFQITQLFIVWHLRNMRLEIIFFSTTVSTIVFNFPQFHFMGAVLLLIILFSRDHFFFFHIPTLQKCPGSTCFSVKNPLKAIISDFNLLGS